MPKRADAHIHLFAGGYQGESFTARPGISIDEAACYDSLAAEHHVTAALVIGFAGEDWCIENNAHLIEQKKIYDWIYPLAYVDINQIPSLQDLDHLQKQGFVGVSMYVFDDDARQLDQVPSAFWQWLDEQRWMVSVNSTGDAWTTWYNVLKQHPRLPLLVSHLGLPPAVTSCLSQVGAAHSLRQITELARFPDVQVKLSGFYALSSPGHDYPHESAWPYVEQLVKDFSVDRLLWASDYTPCLDWVTFPQTIDILEKIPFFNEVDVEKITGRNLLALLNMVKT